MEKAMFHQIIDRTYIGIVTILDYEIVVRKCLADILLPPESNRNKKVVVDLALKSGINQYRFVSFDVSNEGKILWNSSAYVNPNINIVNMANAFLKERKEIVSHSMLSNDKKKELLNV